MSPESLANMLRNGRFRLGHETLLQNDVEEFFRQKCVHFERELRLSRRDRIDFLVAGRIGVELKIKCSARMILRQLTRYAEHDVVTSLILVTLNAVAMPRSIDGKPVYVVNLGAGYL